MVGKCQGKLQSGIIHGFRKTEFPDRPSPQKGEWSKAMNLGRDAKKLRPIERILAFSVGERSSDSNNMRVASNVRGLGSFLPQAPWPAPATEDVSRPHAQKDYGPGRRSDPRQSGLEKERLEIPTYPPDSRANLPVGRRRPVAPDLSNLPSEISGVPGRQSVNIAKLRRGIVAIQSKQQKIPMAPIELAGYSGCM